MEKHIIFLYPLHPVIQELKDILEKDGGYDINEIDDVNEYKQLIGVIGQCITFTSDIRKIHSSLDAQKNLIKNGISKIIIMGKLQGFPQEVGQLRVMGVQEILPETTPLKSLQFKLNLFLKSFEQIEAQKLNQKVLEDKKSNKIVSKKTTPLFVDNENKDQVLKHKNSRPIFENPDAFDFKKYVKSAITPLNIKPVEEKKKHGLLKPLFENKDYQRRQSAGKLGELVFDELPEENESENIVEDSGTQKMKQSHTPLRLVSEKEEEKRQRKKELEAAAELIRKHREGLKLTDEENQTVHKALNIRRDEETVAKNVEDEEEEDLKRKKYQAFKVNEENQEITDGEDEDEDDLNQKKRHQSLRLNQENEGKRRYDPFRLNNPRDKQASFYEDRDRNKEDVAEQIDESDEIKEEGVTSESIVSNDEANRKFVKAEDSQIKNTNLSEAEDLFLHYPDFYFPPVGISTFIPLLLELLHTRPFNQNKFMQFLCFMFQKKMGGSLTFLIERDSKLDLLASTYLLNDKTWSLEKHYTESQLLEMKAIIVPTWSDNTFQSNHLEFYFPFYFNKERMGMGHATFDFSNVKNAQEAMEAELLIVMARTVYLKEFRY